MLRKVNLRDLAFRPNETGGVAYGEAVDVGQSVGAKDTGFRIQRLAPGQRSSRRHRHLSEEEILMVVHGTGTLIHGSERVPVGAGDVVVYRAGEPEAHCFENTGTEPMLIYAFGQRIASDVCIFEDAKTAHVGGLDGEVDLDWVRPGVRV